MLSEIGISQKEFLVACKQAQKDKNKNQWKVVRQILLVDNMDEFRKIMEKRNNELERKALQLMLENERRQVKVIAV